MAKFNIKSLFFKDEPRMIEEEPIQEETWKEIPAEPQIPTPETTITPEVVPAKPAPKAPTLNDELLNQVISMYAKGFDSLNQEGYDFFEFYKAIAAMENPNAQVYTMAFQMAKTMSGNTVSKEKLLESASFYVSEINKVHQNYIAQGEQKKSDLLKEQAEERNTLSKDIQSLNNEITVLKEKLLMLESSQIEKQASLTSLDDKYKQEMDLVAQKTAASDLARASIVGQIEDVRKGIETYV